MTKCLSIDKMKAIEKLVSEYATLRMLNSLTEFV